MKLPDRLGSSAIALGKAVPTDYAGIYLQRERNSNLRLKVIIEKLELAPNRKEPGIAQKNLGRPHLHIGKLAIPMHDGDWDSAASIVGVWKRKHHGFDGSTVHSIPFPRHLFSHWADKGMVKEVKLDSGKLFAVIKLHAREYDHLEEMSELSNWVIRFGQTLRYLRGNTNPARYRHQLDFGGEFQEVRNPLHRFFKTGESLLPFFENMSKAKNVGEVKSQLRNFGATEKQTAHWANWIWGFVSGKKGGKPGKLFLDELRKWRLKYKRP